MPLIIFSVNTEYVGNAAGYPIGVDERAGFSFTKILEQELPPETVFYLKHVAFDFGGNDSTRGGRNKSPGTCLGVHFPQMEEAIYTNRIETKTVQANENISDNAESFGAFTYWRDPLCFPLLCYPTNGSQGSGPTESNVVDRQKNSFEANDYFQRANYDMNIRLGRMVSNGRILQCRLTPYDLRGENMFDRNSKTTRKCRFRRAQIILEYN